MHLVMNAGPGGVGDRYEGTASMMIEAAHCLLENEDAGRSCAALVEANFRGTWWLENL